MAFHGSLHYQDISSICGSADETWQTVDVSNYVPPQAEGVLLYYKNTSASTQYLNVRPKGKSWDDQYGGHAPLLLADMHGYTILQLNTSSEFEIKRSSSDIKIWVTGWVDGAITYLSDRVDVSPVAGAWTETDLSSYIPSGATGAYFYFVNEHTSTAYNIGARTVGSSNVAFWTYEKTFKYFGAGIDGSRHAELYIQNASCKIYLIGYFTAPVHFLTNRISHQIYVNNNWIDLDYTGKFPTNNIDFAFIQQFPSGYFNGIGPKDGSGYTDCRGKQRTQGFVRMNTSCVIQAYTNYRSDERFYADGYQETDSARYEVSIDADVPDTQTATNITYGSTPWGIRWQYKSFIYNGLYWIFYVKQASGIAGKLYYRTSSDAETWSEETFLHDTTYMYGVSGIVWFDADNGKVHIFTKNTPELHYRKGTPEANGTITWDADWQVAFLQSPSGTTVADHSGAIDSSGYPWVSWCYENFGGGYGGMEIYVSGSSTNNGVWTTIGGYPKNLTQATAADNYRVSRLVPLLNRNMYVILLKGDNPPKGRFYTQSTDIWSNVESISNRNFLNTFNDEAYEGWSITASVDSKGNIHLVFTDSNLNIVYVRRDYNTGNWVDETVLKTGVPAYASPQMAIDSSDNLYLFYAESDDHIYMRRRINEVWDGEWTDFLDCSDVGLSYNADVGLDSVINVSKDITNNELIVMTMVDTTPRTIRVKIYEIDNVSFTWNGVTRSTPWNQDGLLAGASVIAIMPATIGEDWQFDKWDDDDTSRTKTITVSADVMHIGLFTSAKYAPTVSTSAATNKSSTGATINGSVSDIGGQTIDERGFDYGTESGVYTDSWTETGSFSTGSFLTTLTLQPFTTYYFRAKAHNASGWGYGTELSFITPQAITTEESKCLFKTVRRCFECGGDAYPAFEEDTGGNKFIRWRCEWCDHEWVTEVNETDEDDIY